MNKFEELKKDLLDDVVFAEQKKYKQSAIQLKLNRVNALIDIYNAKQKDLTFYKDELSAVEMDVMKHLYDGEKLIEKFFLIFEMIGVAREDVKYYLSKSENHLKQINNYTASSYSFKITIPIDKLVVEKDLLHSEYFLFKFMNDINPEVVANGAMDEYMRLRKKFGSTVSK